jgi:hypothetical protein
MIYIILGAIALYVITVLCIYFKLIKNLESRGINQYAFSSGDYFGIWMCAIMFPIGLHFILTDKKERANEK